MQRAVLEADGRTRAIEPTVEEIARGCEDGTIFADLHLESLRDLPTAFPVLRILVRQAGQRDIGMVWQYVAQAAEPAAPEAGRRYPVFHSARFLPVAQATEVHERVRALRRERLRRQLGAWRFWLACQAVAWRDRRDRGLRAVLRWLGQPDPTAPEAQLASPVEVEQALEDAERLFRWQEEQRQARDSRMGPETARPTDPSTE